MNKVSVRVDEEKGKEDVKRTSSLLGLGSLLDSPGSNLSGSTAAKKEERERRVEVSIDFVFVDEKELERSERES